MNIPSKILSNGFSLPVLGLGTWRIGGEYEKDPLTDEQQVTASIHEVISVGITHIDTAEMYAAGYTEELIGKATQYVDRSKLFITSKVWPEHAHFEDVLDAAERSLKRLQTDYLDLYLVHWPNEDIEIEETLEAFDELIEQKLVRNIGVSNFSIKQFQEAQKATKNKLVVNQIHYSLLDQSHEDIVRFCQKNDTLITAYRPLERGLLTNKNNEKINKLCKKYNKTPSQIALNWLISQPNVTTISKMMKKDHLEDNLGAIGWKMESEDMQLLNHFQ